MTKHLIGDVYIFITLPCKSYDIKATIFMTRIVYQLILIELIHEASNIL